MEPIGREALQWIDWLLAPTNAKRPIGSRLGAAIASVAPEPRRGEVQGFLAPAFTVSDPQDHHLPGNG
jgi:hypothetical protein